MRDNLRAFEAYGLVPRVLKDVSRRNQSATLFGTVYASPFGIPPMGFSALSACRGDIVLTRAAKATSIPMILSAASLITLEDMRRENEAAHVELIRRRRKDELVIKGLLSLQDARIARECGVNGVMLSNHGGLQLD